jgi:site-specific recombinase XerD
MPTYAETIETFLDEMRGFRSEHTRRNYRRALDLFCQYAQKPRDSLGAADVAVLVRFAQWLLDEHGLAPATVRLYLSACRQYFEWLGVHDHLPPAFPLPKALKALANKLKSGGVFRVDRRPPEPPEGIEQVIHFYDNLPMPPTLEGKPDRAGRWGLERLRNCALLRCLAESGRRISEVLSLRAGDFPPAAFEGNKVWRVEVEGKGGHKYYLRFLRALPHIERYILARGEIGEGAALFVAHSKRYDDQPLSRFAAWKIVDEARRALGLPRIHPHDFRHWRATVLVNAGEPLDVVQDFLGHRSVETTRAYQRRTGRRGGRSVALALTP